MHLIVIVLVLVTKRARQHDRELQQHQPLEQHRPYTVTGTFLHDRELRLGE